MNRLSDEETALRLELLREWAAAKADGARAPEFVESRLASLGETDVMAGVLRLERWSCWANGRAKLQARRRLRAVAGAR